MCPYACLCGKLIISVCSENEITAYISGNTEIRGIFAVSADTDGCLAEHYSVATRSVDISCVECQRHIRVRRKTGVLFGEFVVNLAIRTGSLFKIPIGSDLKVNYNGVVVKNRVISGARTRIVTNFESIITRSIITTLHIVVVIITNVGVTIACYRFEVTGSFVATPFTNVSCAGIYIACRTVIINAYTVIFKIGAMSGVKIRAICGEHIIVFRADSC